MNKLTTLFILTLTALLGTSAQAANRTWNGGGADNNWGTALNWGGTAPVANDLLFFDGTTRLTDTNNITASTAFGGITFNSTAGAFTLRGNALQLAGGVTNSSTNPETIGLALALTATRTFDVVSGGSLSIGGIISGSAFAVTKVDAGTLALSGVNTYTGGTTISGGTLSVTNDTNLGGTGGLIFANGGTLLNTGTGAQSSARAITLNSGGGVITLSGPTLTLTGAISGGGGLTTGGSDVVLNQTANNTIGTLTVASGRLFVFTTYALANATVVVNNGGTIDFGTSASASPTNSMTFASGGCVANRLAGTLTLSTATSTFPSAGTMIFNADDQATTAITVNGAYPALTGDLTVQVGGGGGAAGNVTLSGAISGSYGLLKTSTGTVILSGANSYTGDTTITTGTLKLGAANVIPDGSGKGNVNVNGKLDLGGFSDTINGLSGSGTVDNTVGTGAYTLTVGNNDQTSTFSGTLTDTTGALCLTKVGAGTLTLSGATTCSGTATVLAGTLEVQADGGLGSITNVSVGTGATLMLDSGTSNNYINDAAVVSLTNTAVVNLAFTGSDTVANLYINSVHKVAGTWGATGSGATYIDDAHFQGAGVLNVTSGPTSTTTVASSANPSIWGASVTFTATVTGVNGTPPPTGTVTFKDGAAVLGTGTLSGSPTATATFSTNGLTISAHSITAVYSGDNNFAGSTSSVLTQNVTPGPLAKLQLLMPGETATPGVSPGKTGTPSGETAGTSYTVTVNGVDANWNVVNTNDTIAITSSDANATLPASAALATGTKTFSMTNKTVGTWTVTASDTTHGTVTASTSPSFTVNVGAFAKLQLLMQGEVAAPGTATGKTAATPSAQNTDNPFTVTVNGVDANWNVVSTASDTVHIASTDVNAALPGNAALSGGTQTFSFKFNTTGSWTVTASDTSDGTKSSNTSPSITVNLGAFAKLQVLMPGESAAAGTTTGKTGSPTAQTAGTSFNVTVRSVDGSWNLISTNDTVHLASSDAQATLAANTALGSGTVALSVTFKTSGSQTVTASDTSHNLIGSNTGTATTVNNAAASKLVIATQPASTATAGVIFSQQPVIYVEDAYNNICATNSTVTATRNAGAGNLLGTTNMVAISGVVTYTDLAHPYATNITINFTSSGLTAATSGTIAVSTNVFSQLVVLVPGQTNAPGIASGIGGTATAQVAGTAFAVKVLACDAYGNLITNVTDTVAITSSDATAVLPASAALINGTNSFNVTLKDEGTQTVTATDSTTGSQTGTSSAITVSAAALAKLQLLMPGEFAAPGTSSGKTGTTSAETAGTSYTVTVNAVDSNWNVVNTNDTVAITSGDANATLPASAGLVAGTKTFTVTNKTVGTWTVTASDTTHAGVTANISPSFAVSVGAFAKLQILVPGMNAAPGTASGYTSSATAQNTDNPFNVTVNAVDANWNLVNTAGDTVAITSSDPNAALPSSAALVSGTQTFGVKFNTAGGTRTVTATDSSDGTKAANVSPAITVNLGAFAKLQVLLPGETAAPGTATGQAGSPTAQVAGTAFNLTVNAVDASFNLINNTNDTVHLASTDANATLAANTAMAAGTVTLSVTLKTVGSWTFTASDMTHTGIGSDNSSTVAANVGAFAKLQLLVPGETAAPGSGLGKTGTPSAETAGTAYSVTVNAVDANWNVVNTNDTVGITSTDTHATLPANAALAAGTRTISLTNNTAGSWTVTATDITHGSIPANTSPSITVAAGAFTKLQLLMPGETAAAGTTTGKTGTPSAEAAGTAFNVIVNAVDANWNVVNTVTDTIDISSTDANAALPADAALAAGTKTFSVTLKTEGSATVTATDTADGTKTANTSPSTTVNAGALAKLQLLMPGETAAPGTGTGKTGTPNAETAGTSYTVTVNAVDANWNVVNTNDTIAITSSDANATLPASAALATGTKTFSMTNKTVGTWTVTASDTTHTGVTASTSPSFAVNVGAFAKLQLLMPGEVAAPGTATGKTAATPSAQNTDNPFTVTVNGVDANWNVVSTASDTVHIASSDANAALPGNAALSGGTVTFGVKFNTSGSATVTASDVTDGTKSSNTSPSITVNLGAFAKLQVLMPGESAAAGTTTGKTGSPTAQTAGTSFSVTVRSVDASWNLISTNDTVHLASSDASATLPVNTALTVGSVTLSLTNKTSGSQTVTASDTSHTSIGSNTGTATTVNNAAATKLVIATQPSSTATAGAAFTQQPVINVEDAYNNICATNSTVTATRNAGAGNLLGTTNLAAVSGVVTYTDLAHPYATNITITFTSSGLTAATSGTIAVSTNVFSQLVVLAPGQTNAPGTTSGIGGTATTQVAGTAFAVKVLACDAYGNLITNVTDTVAITSSDATAGLPANAALINGTNSFTVTLNDEGSQTVTATDSTTGSQTGTSSAITVNAALVAKLQLLLPGETAAPGTTTGKTGTPNAETAGTSYTVTVNAVDADWNLVSTNTHTVGINSTDPNDVMPANTALVAGTKTFSVTNKTAGSWTMTATDITDGTKTANTSPLYTVNPAAFAKLQILVPGMSAAPGTASGYGGVTNAQTTDNPFTVTVNAVDANWNLVSTASDTVSITSSDPNAALPSSAALSGGTQTYGVKFNTAGGTRTVTATDLTDGTKTANVSPAITVTVGAFAQLQILLPGQTAVPGSPAGQTGSATAQTAGTAFNVTINAVDASYNLVNTNDVVATTSSDANAALPVNVALVAGARTNSVTLKTVGSWTVTASNVTHPAITADTSSAVTANPGVLTKLQLLVPGETTAPGTTTGKTGTPSAETAGSGFSVTVNAVDANWNLISTNDTIKIYSSDANAGLPANAALSAGSQTFSVTLKTAPSATVTASNVTHSAVALNTSPSITVVAGAFAKLQLLMPGETTAAGTTTGKTGTPSAEAAGTAFNATVNAVDANWNLVNTVTDTIDISTTDANAVLPADAALAAGTKTFSVTLKTEGSATVTATDTTDGTKTANTSPSTTVNAGALAKLQLLMPGEVAAPGTGTGKTGTPNAETAGTSYTVTVNAVDANWNLVNTNTHTVGLTSTDPNPTLPANTALVAGTKTLSLTNKTVGSWTVTATDITDGTKTANTSPSFAVNVGAFAKLQILVPGLSAAPGTASGYTGTTTAQNTDNPFSVTVNGVDANWNVVSSASDTVHIASSDANAALPGNAALSSGTQTFAVKFNTTGSWTVTASDTSDGTKSSNTSPSITVNLGAFAKLQVLMPGESAAAGTTAGKAGSPTAQTAGASFSVTVRSVDGSWNLISTNDTVHLASSDASATLPINTALSSGSVTLSLTNKTSGSQTVTASDVTHTGIASNTGTATTVNNAAASKLVIATQPSSTATAGVIFSPQPVINVEDAYNNICATNSTITATRNAGAGNLLGTTNLAAVSGVVTYTDLAHLYATNITITFTSSGLTAATSGTIAVSTNVFSQLVVLAPGQTNAPGTASGIGGTATAQVAGTAFAVKVLACDAYGNLITNVTDTVAITSSDATAVLPASAALINGTNSFTVTLNDAGSRTVTATDSTTGSQTGTSSAITVNGALMAKLQLLLPGETAAPGTTTGKTGTPNAETAGASYTVTVNAVDANWNLVSTNTHTVGINSTDPNDVMPANTALVAGTKTFSVTNKTAGSWTMTATDITDGTKTANTSPLYTVNPAAFAKLQILVPGMSAAPGTTSGYGGVTNAQTTDNSFSVTVNAVDANWNLVNTASDTVGITSTDPNAALPSSAALSGGTQTFSVKFNTAGGTRTVTATDLTDGTKTANVSPAITVTVGAFAQLQILVPGQTAVPGSPAGQTGSATAQTAGTAFNVTINAVDASYNLVNTNDMVATTSSDANAALPANVALVAGARTNSVTLKTVGSWTVTASDVTHAGFAPETSSAVTVNAGIFAKLQLLVPGETAAPGSTLGKTGTPGAETAGSAFSVTVHAVDANWNLISTNDTIKIYSSDANAGLPATNALSGGSQTFSVTLKTAPSATVTASNVTHSVIALNTSPSISINPAAPTAIRVETLANGSGTVVPAQTNSAGAAITVYAIARDTYGNFVINIAADAWSLTNKTAGVLDSDLVPAGDSKSAVFTGHVPGTANIHVDSAGLSSTDSGKLTVVVGALAKLQLLMPGETAAPGTSAGKTGTPNAETAGASYTVTVNAVDGNWNLVNTNDTVAITSSDVNATLPASTVLVTGTKTFTVTNKTAGTWTVTASDSTHSGVTANISPTFTVNVGAFAKLQLLMPGEVAAAGTGTGKTAATPTAQNTDNPFSVTVNAVDANWNLVNTVGDTVGITSSDAHAALPGNAALSSGTQTFGVKFNTAGSRTVTATDITDGTKTANTGAATTVNAGAFAQLQILLPGESAAPGLGKTGMPSAQIAGTAFNATVNAMDASYNIVSTNDTVHLASTDANATLAGNTAMAAGTISLSVTLKTVGSWTVTASDVTHALIATNTSAAVTANVGAFAKLQLLVPGESAAAGSTSGKTGTPSAETAGTGYSVTVNAVDANWNVVNTNDTVGITSTDTHAVLPANATLLAGTKTLSLTSDTAGSWTVTATDITHGSIPANTSPSITVTAGAFAKLQLLMPGETAAAGTTTGKTGTPGAQTAGTALNVTVNAVDANWNRVNTVSDMAGITSSDANAVLPANAALSSGTQMFSVTFHTAGSQTATASDVTDGSKTANTGTATTVNAGAVDHYAVATSSPNNAGVPFTTTVTAQDSFNNTVTTNTATVTLTGTGNVQFDSNGDDVYGDNTKALAGGVLTIATKDNFAETVNIIATANSKTGTLTGLVITPATGAYESVATGNWSDLGTWNTYDGSNWIAATVPPASTNAPTITIQSNTTVTVTANVAAVGLIVQSTGQITVGSGQTLTIPNGTGTDLDVAGTVSVLGTLAISSAADVQIEAGGSLQDSGTVNVVGTLTASTGASVAVNTNGVLQNSGTIASTASTLAFNSGGTYQHAYTTAASTIPTATWNTNSTCAIIGYTSNTSAPGGLGQTFGNFTWNCPSQTGTIDLGGALATVKGNLTVTSTGSSTLRLSGNLTVGGNFSMSSGTLDMTSGTLSTVTLTIGGNFSHTGGTLTVSGFLSTGNVVFNKAGLQTYTSGGTVNSVNFTVNSGSTLVMGTSSVSGSGTFTLSSGAGLQIGSPAGITTSGATGNIQATGTRTFNTGANYTYNGTAAQVTGNGLPATVSSLTVSNSAGVTLTATVAVNGALTLTNGVLTTGANQVNVAAAGSIAGASSTSYVSGTVQKAFNTGAGQSFTYPIGDASEYAPFSLASMNVTVAGSLAAKTTAGDHPNIATSGINAARSVNRYWTLTAVGSFAATDPGTFNYLASDVDGAATPAQFVVRRYSAGAWNTVVVSGTPTTTATTVSGAIASGDFAIGNQAIDHYVVSAATSQMVNTPFLTTVTAYDILSQPVPGDSSTVVTMTGSTNTVQFDSNGDSIFGDNTKTLSGGTFTISTEDTMGGTITLTATDANSRTGTSSPINVTGAANQTISFGPLTNQTYGNAPFTVSATASSGLPVTFSIVSGPATVAGNTVTITGAGTVTVAASQAGNGTWNAATNVNQSFTVAPAQLTVTASAQSKTYGQTVTFGSGSTAFTSSGLQNSDTIGSVTLAVSGNGGAANAPVSGSPYTITPSAATGGAFTAANYNITYNTGTLTVNLAALNVSASGTLVYGQDPSNAVYSAFYYPLQGTDTLSVVSGSADFSTDATATNYVGTNYTVTVLDTGTLTAANYSIAAGTNGIMTITPASLTVTNLVADDKTYDGATNATLDASGAGLDGLVNGDAVTLNTNSETGDFADKNVGMDKPVTVSGLALSGDLGTNYTLVQPAATASIWPLAITVTAAADTKAYDGTTNSVGVPAPSPALAPGDSGSFTQTFDTRNVGTGKTLTPVGTVSDGNGGANYNITFAAVTTGEIDPAPITVTAVTDTKPYDGTTSSVGAPTYTALAAGDTTASFSQTFDTRNVGTGKTLTPAGVVNDGNSGLNYNYTYATVATGEIDPEPITVTAAADSKIYDGTTASAGVPTITAGSLISGDTAVWTQTFDTRNVGTGKTLTPAGTVSDGNGGNNYSVSFLGNSTGVITALGLTVTGITADNKPYDGTTAATIHTAGATLLGQVSGDDVTLNTAGATGAFADASVGTGKTVFIIGLTLNGATVGNYSLTQPTATADITAEGLTVVGIEASNKVYDGTTNATLNVTNAALVGVISGDDVSLSTTNAVGAFVDKNVGTAKTVNITGLALYGADAGKYTLTQPTTNADITAVSLTVAGLTANSKPYDGNATATLNGTAALSAGVVGSEDVTLGGTPVAAFDTQNAGTAKPVTVSGYALAGADIGNYTLSQPAGLSADITAAGLTVTGITANNKVYDGTTTATLNTGSASLVGVVGGETVTLDASSAVGAFADSNAGTGKAVSVSGVTIGGADAGNNYSLTQPTATADITPASSALTVNSSANPSPTGSNVTFTASVSILPPGGGALGGTVQFVVDGAPFGEPAAISSGVASLSSSALAHGSHTVAAQYAGNGNFQGSTNSLSPDQLINTSPVGYNMTMSAMKNQSTNLSATKLALKCTDADGDSLSVTAVDASSAQGGTVSLSGTTIIYTPPTNYVGADSFNYTVSDTYGATGTGTVSVTIESIQVSPTIQNLTQLPDGNMQLKASGIPGESYVIQAAADLNSPWNAIGTNAADINGVIVFSDLNATNYTGRFYRLAAP